jgi:nicotinamide-nucleotide amidase
MNAGEVIDDELREIAVKFIEGLRRRELRLVTAESCTGGLIAAVITETPGSSHVLERGYVTYSNEAKESMLGVRHEIIDRHGAVSEQTARAMAEGALAGSPADVAVSVTGIAGPDGGTSEKPVGLVHFAAARRGGRTLHKEMRFGDLGRTEVRRRSVITALALVDDLFPSD